MKKTPEIIVVLVTVASLLPMRCANPNGGNGSDIGNARITAMLYNQGGTPAANAKVCFYPHDNDPRPGKGTGPVDSTTTDANGNYIAVLDSGTYNILATLGDKATFQDSVVLRRGDTTKPPPDTVKALGSISGKIELQGTDDPRTVFILFMGTNTFAAVSDTQGNFAAANMAKGRYRVRILTTLDNYKVMDTVFGITAGVDSVIVGPIRLEYTGIPVVGGLRIGYDTMRQIVTLRWDRADTGLVISYNVYRRNVGLNTVLARINTSPVTDTVYRDSTGVQDSMYEYVVAAVSLANMEGTKSAVASVKIVGLFNLVRTWGSFGNGQGQMNSPVAIDIDSKGLIYVADENNNRIEVFDTTGLFVREFGDSILHQPCDIAIQDSVLFVVSNGDKKIYKLSLTGDTLGHFVLPTTASFAHIAVDSNQNIYTIPSTSYGKIQVYSDTGLKSEFSLAGDYHWGIQLIVSTILTFNGRDSLIQRYSLAGDLQNALVLNPATYPVAVAGRSDMILVLNGGKYISGFGVIGINVLVYDSNYRYLAQWGSNIDFVSVADIAIDQNGSVYILDQDGSKIRKFSK